MVLDVAAATASCKRGPPPGIETSTKQLAYSSFESNGDIMDGCCAACMLAVVIRCWLKVVRLHPT